MPARSTSAEVSTHHNPKVTAFFDLTQTAFVSLIYGLIDGMMIGTPLLSMHVTTSLGRGWTAASQVTLEPDPCALTLWPQNQTFDPRPDALTTFNNRVKSGFVQLIRDLRFSGHLPSRSGAAMTIFLTLGDPLGNQTVQMTVQGVSEREGNSDSSASPPSHRSVQQQRPPRDWAPVSSEAARAFWHRFTHRPLPY